MKLQYQINFLHHATEPDSPIRTFSEWLSHDEFPTSDYLMSVIRKSFLTTFSNDPSFDIQTFEFTENITHQFSRCTLTIVGYSKPIAIDIRIRPSLVIGDKIFKLEEMDF